MFSRNSVFDNNFEILRESLINDSSDPYDNARGFNSDDLRPIEEIPHPYQQVFAGYPGFNIIQSRVIDDVLYTDDSLCISAPTGSGKTAIFELAIVRLLISLEQTQFCQPFKIVYISPMKSLCEERLVDWHKKFTNFGINCISVTGDSENIEFQSLLNHNLIITTPEKWDCLTRKWRENIKLVQIIKLFMIDEIHLLNEESRGSTLETIVCRMKTIEKSVNPEEADSNHQIRFLAVSATVPNIEDVAEWIGSSSRAKCHKFSDEYRPVKLKKIVLGYSQGPKSNTFKFDMSLNYKLQGLIQQYSHGKPTLIFCGTRKIVEMTARHILQHSTITLKPDEKDRLVAAAATISDAKVRETLVHGVGYHHAGMLPETRRTIENLFRLSELPILVTTSTLAVGVNLPAHLVIIKSTKCYANGGFRDYGETALLQMIGRAGRPQFDTEATALVLTTSKDKEKFEKMIGGLQPIESDLHRHLTEHLNAEVVLQTITDLEVAMRWLSSTFLYVRARKNPRYYGLTSSDPSIIDRRLLEMCQIELNKLIKAGMLSIDQDVLLKATPVGSAMAKYYLAFETMRLFTQITGGEILQQILGLISKCHEFSEMYLRVNDKKCLNLLNKCRTGQTIRFTLNGKIKTLDMKINCIIQAVLGCLNIFEHSLLTETLKIMRNGERIVKCLIEYLESKEKCYKALLSTITLAKCFHVKLWENSPYVSKQLPGIGTVMSSQLVNAGKTSFRLISECDAREIEMIINKKPPAGSKILKQIQNLPKYEIKLEIDGKNRIKLTVTLQAPEDLAAACTVNRNSLMYLLVGDTANNILLYEKYSHSFFIENVEVIRYIDFPDKYLEDIEAHFISEDWVGIDCTKTLEMIPKPKNKEVKERTPTASKKNKSDNLAYMQHFMEVYMQSKKDKEVVSNGENLSGTNESDKIIIHENITIADPKRQRVEESDNYKKPQFTRNEESSLPGFIKTSSFFSPSNEEFFASQNSKVGNSDSVTKKFQFTPKKLTHKRSLEFEVGQNSQKKLHVDDKPKSQTKITWRSPLTYSPPVKFSPKIASCSENEILSRTSSSPLVTQNQETVSKILNKSSSSFCRPSPKLNSSQSKIFFPLSDKAYADSSLDDSMDRRDDVLDKIGDVVSTSLLENYGLISPLEKPRIQKQIKTPNEYYHQLLSQPQAKENTREEKQKIRDSIVTTSASKENEKSRQQSKKVFQNDQNHQAEFSTQSPYFTQHHDISVSNQNQNITSHLSSRNPKSHSTSKADFLANYQSQNLPHLSQRSSKLPNTSKTEFLANYQSQNSPLLSSRSSKLPNTSKTEFLANYQTQNPPHLSPRSSKLTNTSKTEFLANYQTQNSPQLSSRSSKLPNTSKTEFLPNYQTQNSPRLSSRSSKLPNTSKPEFLANYQTQNSPRISARSSKLPNTSKTEFPTQNPSDHLNRRKKSEDPGFKFENDPQKHYEEIGTAVQRHVFEIPRRFDTSKFCNSSQIMRRHEAPEERISEEDEDPFNDSFDSVLMKMAVPSDKQENRLLSRRNSANLADLENISVGVLTDIEEDPFDRMTEYEKLYRSDSRDSRLSRRSTKPDYSYLTEDLPNFAQTQYIPQEQNYQNQKFLRRPELPVRRNSGSFQCPVYQEADSRRREPFYPHSFSFENCSPFEGSYPERQSFRRNRDFDCSFNSSSYFPSDYQRNDECESYGYLRRIMEKENDPFLFEENPYPSNYGVRKNLNSFDVVQGRRTYPVPDQVLPFDDRPDFIFDQNRTYRAHLSQLPYREQNYVAPRSVLYPKTPTQLERSNYYEPYYFDKDYLMRRFFKDMKTQDEREHFYN